MTEPMLCRSCLYVPGDKPRFVEKALGLAPDILILDLEDAVAPEAKAAARTGAAEVLAGVGDQRVVVRINAIASEWGRADREAMLEAGAGALMLPKVDAPGDLAAAAAKGVALWAMIETPRAILSIDAIAAAPGLVALVIGINDLAKDMRAAIAPGRAAFQAALSMTLMAARAHGLAAIDGVFNDLSDEAGFAVECDQGRALGFDGKSLIHPAQLGACNRIFSPDPEAVARARALVAAFEAPENAGKGVLRVGGAMAEHLHLAEARRLLALDGKTSN